VVSPGRVLAEKSINQGTNNVIDDAPGRSPAGLKMLSPRSQIREGRVDGALGTAILSDLTEMRDEIFEKYDQDSSGVMSQEEASIFLRDVFSSFLDSIQEMDFVMTEKNALEKAAKDPVVLSELASILLEHTDLNHDGMTTQGEFHKGFENAMRHVLQHMFWLQFKRDHKAMDLATQTATIFLILPGLYHQSYSNNMGRGPVNQTVLSADKAAIPMRVFLQDTVAMLASQIEHEVGIPSTRLRIYKGYSRPLEALPMGSDLDGEVTLNDCGIRPLESISAFGDIGMPRDLHVREFAGQPDLEKGMFCIDILVAKRQSMGNRGLQVKVRPAWSFAYEKSTNWAKYGKGGYSWIGSKTAHMQWDLSEAMFLDEDKAVLELLLIEDGAPEKGIIATGKIEIRKALSTAWMVDILSGGSTLSGYRIETSVRLTPISKDSTEDPVFQTPRGTQVDHPYLKKKGLGQNIKKTALGDFVSVRYKYRYRQ